jgi:hypothetical protein
MIGKGLLPIEVPRPSYIISVKYSDTPAVSNCWGKLPISPFLFALTIYRLQTKYVVSHHR